MEVINGCGFEDYIKLAKAINSQVEDSRKSIK